MGLRSRRWRRNSSITTVVVILGLIRDLLMLWVHSYRASIFAPVGGTQHSDLYIRLDLKHLGRTLSRLTTAYGRTNSEPRRTELGPTREELRATWCRMLSQR